MKIKKKHSFFEAEKENYLGFYGYDIFELNAEEISLNDFINNSILSDENSVGEFGPFVIKKLNISDFIKVDFIELNNLLEKYYEDENWGDDLEVFKLNVIKVFEKLNIKQFEIYFINLENVRDEIKPEYNIWTYYIGILCIDRIEKKFIKIYFGGD